MIVAQLRSIYVFAAGAPVILVGTRKDQVSGGDQTIAQLGATLLEALKRRCEPAIAGLVRDEAGNCPFFAIENAKGLQGDATMRELVKAIESAARQLPSMKQMVPLRWLRVRDAMAELQKSQQLVALDEVRALAEAHGLPHEGLSLDVELPAMLSYFHSLNDVLWYDTPTLRHLVILEPKWVVDAATCFIRSFNLKDHTEKFERMAAIDERAKREVPNEWELLTKGQATLRPTLLNILWSADAFKSYQKELIELTSASASSSRCPRPTNSSSPRCCRRCRHSRRRRRPVPCASASSFTWRVRRTRPASCSAPPTI